MKTETRELAAAAREERRRKRIEAEKKERVSRKAKRKALALKRAKALAARRKDLFLGDSRRRRIGGSVCWRENGITRLHRDSIRGIIYERMKERFKVSQPVKISTLQRIFDDVLHGANIRPHLFNLELSGHIDFEVVEDD
jgi:hypothetical protein